MVILIVILSNSCCRHKAGMGGSVPSPCITISDPCSTISEHRNLRLFCQSCMVSWVMSFMVSWAMSFMVSWVMLCMASYALLTACTPCFDSQSLMRVCVFCVAPFDIVDTTAQNTLDTLVGIEIVERSATALYRGADSVHRWSSLRQRV